MQVSTGILQLYDITTYASFQFLGEGETNPEGHGLDDGTDAHGVVEIRNLRMELQSGH